MTYLGNSEDVVIREYLYLTKSKIFCYQKLAGKSGWKLFQEIFTTENLTFLLRIQKNTFQNYWNVYMRQDTDYN